MYTHTARQPLPPQRRNMVQSDSNRDLCTRTSCRKLGPFKIFVASLQEADSYLLMKLLCSYEALLFHWVCAAFFFLFDCWLKCSTFKFFIKKQKTKEWDQSPTKLCSKSCHLQDQRTQYVSIYNFFMLKTWLWKAKSLQTDGIRHGNQWIVCI